MSAFRARGAILATMCMTVHCADAAEAECARLAARYKASMTSSYSPEYDAPAFTAFLAAADAAPLRSTGRCAAVRTAAGEIRAARARAATAATERQRAVDAVRAPVLPDAPAIVAQRASQPAAASARQGRPTPPPEEPAWTPPPPRDRARAEPAAAPAPREPTARERFDADMRAPRCNDAFNSCMSSAQSGLVDCARNAGSGNLAIPGTVVSAPGCERSFSSSVASCESARTRCMAP